jgi:hypothetical protein
VAGQFLNLCFLDVVGATDVIASSSCLFEDLGFHLFFPKLAKP